MGYRAHADLLQELDAISLPKQQRCLIQGILSALDPEAHLGEHVASSGAALLALTRAQGALAGHGGEQQPQWGLLQRVLQTSIDVCREAQSAYLAGGGSSSLTAALDILTAAEAEFSLKRANTSQATTTDAARQLDVLLGTLAAAVRGWIVPLWDGKFAEIELIERLTTEVSAAVALSGRDDSALRVAIRRLAADAKLTVPALCDVLWPTARHFRLALLVRGTRSLQRLDSLLPNARQWPIIGATDPTTHMPPAGEIRAFARWLGQLDASATVVEFSIEAADAQSAATYGRRKLSEVLDQYAAGERLVRLTISHQWLALGHDGKATHGSFRPRTKKVVYPLTSYWPAALGPALRTANLARQVDAPMLSGGLSWSALESAGVKPKEVRRLAKACALQTLRQQMVSLYTVVTTGAKAALERQRRRLAEGQGRLEAVERAMIRCGAADSDRARQALIDYTLQANEERVRVADAERSCQADQMMIETLYADLLVQVQVVGSKEYLVALDAWTEIIMPQRVASSDPLIRAQTAVGNLADYAGGHTRHLLLLWQDRFAKPISLADWILSCENRYSSLLEWLYVTRNLSFHKGRFLGPVDVLTAHAGREVAHTTLEFLGNYRSIERSRGEAETSAARIIEILAERKDALDSRLRAAATCHPLLLDHISGPDEDWWTRS